VEVLHGGLTNVVSFFVKEVEANPEDVVLGITSLSFDIATLELLLPLVVGASIRLLSREEAMDGHVLKKEVERVTLMQATPSTWRVLLEAGWQGKRGLKAITGGEALSWDLATKLSERVGRVWNVYGPTETTIWSATWEVDRSRGRVGLGRGLANTTLYVLDGNMEPVPACVTGELFIGGEGLARGYLGRLELTAERFVADPFRKDGGRLYRTGDAVRWSPDGILEFVGRLDSQTKIRGFRVEPGEVEPVLQAHPAVKACAVVVKKSETESRLIAYYVVDGAEDVEAGGLRQYLGASLPEYMVPSLFVRLPALPLIPSGKVDRKNLSERDVTDAGLASPHDGTRMESLNGLELALSNVWKQVLGAPIGDVRRSFFEYGGTSVQLVQVQNRIKAELRLDITVAELLGCANIEMLAARIEQCRQDVVAPSGAPVQEASPSPAKPENPPAETMSLEDLERFIDERYQGD
jgi:acyl-CoA synthetase (AMP-forming)/AMP-acid ligase II